MPPPPTLAAVYSKFCCQLNKNHIKTSDNSSTFAQRGKSRLGLETPVTGLFRLTRLLPLSDI